jgi:hypothetical protein
MCVCYTSGQQRSVCTRSLQRKGALRLLVRCVCRIVLPTGGALAVVFMGALLHDTSKQVSTQNSCQLAQHAVTL